jgi:glycosyltransferase involved in cell wall biosynthesis
VRALVVAYSFPPVGGAGVQRAVKLAKYLPHHGVQPTVLTVANPSVPLRDESLLGDVPPDVDVVRARTWEPGYAAKKAAWGAEANARAAGAGAGADRRSALRAAGLRLGGRLAREVLFPDPQVLWQPGAHRVLLERIAARRDDVVLVSGPPFSQFLLAPLACAAGLGVVLDYRDEWSTLRSSFEMGASRVARAVGDSLEGALLRRAHAVVTATDEFRDHLLARFAFLDPARVFAILNGYDSDDFPTDLPAPPPDRFVVTYAGTVFSLTSARGLLGGVRRLHARAPDEARALRVRFLGRVVETEADAFAGTEALGVERAGYVPHGEVVRALAASHMCLCILDDAPGAERIYPAKIFELMRLGRAVLTLAPPGSALAKLAARHGLGPVVHPRDEEGIAGVLFAGLHEAARRPFSAPAWRNAPEIARYDRRALAGEFAEILRDVAVQAGRRGS